MNLLLFYSKQPHWRNVTLVIKLMPPQLLSSTISITIRRTEMTFVHSHNFQAPEGKLERMDAWTKAMLTDSIPFQSRQRQKVIGSVSVAVQRQHVHFNPDLEFWTYSSSLLMAITRTHLQVLYIFDTDLRTAFGHKRKSWTPVPQSLLIIPFRPYSRSFSHAYM